MIKTSALTKRYGAQRAVDAVDLDVAEGDVYGFLGANGSGKTTTVRMLLGLVLPTAGRAEVLGQPMPAARSRVLPQIGALVEGPGRTRTCRAAPISPCWTPPGRTGALDDFAPPGSRRC